MHIARPSVSVVQSTEYRVQSSTDTLYIVVLVSTYYITADHLFTAASMFVYTGGLYRLDADGSTSTFTALVADDI